MTTTYAEASTASDAPTRRDDILAALTTAGSPVQGLPASSPDRGIVEAEAAFLAHESLLRAGVAASISPSTAVSAGDSWVDAAVGWYGGTFDAEGNFTPTIQRISASFAVWVIGLKCPSTSQITIQPGDIIQAQSTTGQVFNLTLRAGSNNIQLNSGSSFKAPTVFTARLAGTKGNVTPGTIVALITKPAGLDIDGTFTQVLITAARDEETSPAVITRALGSLTRVGAAWIAQSFDYLIPLFAPNVTRWTVDDSNPLGPGSILVRLADAAGPASSPEAAAVQAGLRSKPIRALGTGLIVAQPATAKPVTFNITIAGDGTNPLLHAAATAALQTLLSGASPIGPCALAATLLYAVALGGAFSGTTPIIAGDGPPYPMVEMPLTLPGFHGAAAVASFSSSTGDMENTGFQTLGAGEVLVPTIVVTVE